MFRAPLCPSSGEQDRVLLDMVFCTGCVGCGCVELGRKVCALCAPHNHSQHNQCRTPYAEIHGLDLLMMGIMMPETCWDRSLIINIGLIASCWFISLNSTFHDARSQEPKTCKGKQLYQGISVLTILSDTYKYLNYMVRPLWPLLDWIQQKYIHYNVTDETWHRIDLPKTTYSAHKPSISV